MTKITKEQLWYIVQVYPESVSPEEAIKEYEKQTFSAIDNSYWQARANIVNKVVSQ